VVLVNQLRPAGLVGLEGRWGPGDRLRPVVQQDPGDQLHQGSRADPSRPFHPASLGGLGLPGDLEGLPAPLIPPARSVAQSMR
jgi:hypothetical protein